MQLFGKKALMDSLQKPQTIVVVNILHDINLENLLQKHNVKFNIKDKNYFKQFDEKLNHQNVVLEVVNNEKYDDIEKFLNENKNEVSILLIIDSIQDPQNFGSIIRTCEAFGVDGIIYKKNSQVQVNDLVVKASTGAIKNVNMFPVVNLSSTVELLKKHNYWIYASALQDKTIDYAKIKYDKKTVLIVGSEQSGISQLLLKNSDFIIKIPMFGTVQSLNASVSTGIMVAEIVKQLK